MEGTPPKNYAGSIEQCYSNVSIKGSTSSALTTYNIGGIAGSAAKGTTIRPCQADGNIEVANGILRFLPTINAGGIVGDLQGSMNDVLFTGGINVDNVRNIRAGGLAGNAGTDASITNGFVASEGKTISGMSLGALTRDALSFVGGAVGKAETANIENVAVILGMVSSTAPYTSNSTQAPAGIITASDVTIEKAYYNNPLKVTGHPLEEEGAGVRGEEADTMLTDAFLTETLGYSLDVWALRKDEETGKIAPYIIGLNDFSVTTYTITLADPMKGGTVGLKDIAVPEERVVVANKGDVIVLDNETDREYKLDYYTVDGVKIDGDSFTLEKDVTVSVVFKMKDFYIYGASVTPAELFQANYYVMASDSHASLDDLTLRFTVTHDDPENPEVIELTSADAVKNGVYNIYTIGVAAKELGDNIRADLVSTTNPETVYDTYEFYSIREYFEWIVGEFARENQDITEKMNDVAVSALNFCAAAQTYYKYKTDALVNEILTGEQKTVNFDAEELAEYKQETRFAPEAANAFALIGCELLYDDDIKIRVYLDRDKENLDYYTFTVDGPEDYDKMITNPTLTPTALSESPYPGEPGYEGIDCYVDVPGIGAYRLDADIKIQIEYDDGDIDETDWVTYSATEYLADKIPYLDENATNDDGRNLCAMLKALFVYFQAAKAYAVK